MVSFSSEHIVKNTYIPPRSKVCTSFLAFSFLEGELEEREKNGMVDQLHFTRCCSSASSGQHRGSDECLISRNTSQIAKVYLP